MIFNTNVPASGSRMCAGTDQAEQMTRHEEGCVHGTLAEGHGSTPAALACGPGGVLPTVEGGRQLAVYEPDPAHGHCDCERRLVEIGVISEDEDALDLLLIHEAAHAVASPAHGVRWQRRIACAAATARKVGRIRLAELLDEEVANYRDRSQPVSVAYGEVEDALRDNPDLTLAQIWRWLAGLYGLRLGDVGKVFPRLKRVYEQARTEALESRKMR